MNARFHSLVMLLGLAVLAPAFANGSEISSKATATTTNQCKPCRDGDTPVPCKGEALGLRIDDSRSYTENIPPSSELSVVPPMPMPGSAIIPSLGPAPAPKPVLQPEKKIEIVKPAPPAVMVRMNDTMGGSLFATNRAELRPGAIKQLDALARSLKGKKDLRIQAIGHTDSVPVGTSPTRRFKSNQELSEARAASVARYLQKALEMPDDAITTSGKGETEPIADNSTVEGKARNRRTDISVWYDVEAPPVVQELVEPPKITSLETPALPVPEPVIVPPSKPKSDASCGKEGPADQNNLPFRITVDGQPLEQDNLMPEADRRRCVDKALAQADIQLRYDPLQAKPALNVWTTVDSIVRGEAVGFSAYTNYAAWIRNAEVRIFRFGENTQAQPLAVVPAEWNAVATWTPPADAPEEMQFLLRVYDKQGRFDETAIKPLRLLDKQRPHADIDKPERERLTGWGQDSRALANIPVFGGTITINGTGIDQDQIVQAMGQSAPVDKDGKFALRQVLPAGPHTVSVEVINPGRTSVRFSRNLTIPDNDWFYVAIGDLTVGQNHVTGPAQLVNPDSNEYDNNVYINGRGAFYLKGTIKGEYLLTASADTREQQGEDLFSNFSSKDPRSLLRRIDPDRYYPVYGDDSTLVEDAPTEGKFYVRLEKGDSHILWGNFQTRWTGTELTQFNRSLYGGQLVLNSSNTTRYGERKSTLSAFAADPGTLQAREEFRGTGGSLYYLQHMDLTRGSERVWVEVRDRDSGLVIERKQLVPVQDYDINYLQGRVMLRAPLSSVTGGGTFIALGSLPGNPVFLVATYEYVPGLTAVEGSTLGGNAAQWFGDYFKLGVTGYRQGENSQEQKLFGVDSMLRYKPGTSIKAEFARSEGSGAGAQNSITGGFDFSTNGAVGQRADASRIEAALDLADLTAAARGTGSLYWQERGQGFSGPGELTPGEAVRQIGGRVVLPVGKNFETEVKGDDRSSLSQEAKNIEATARWQFSRDWQAAAGVRDDKRWNAAPNASQTLSENGERTDAQLRMHYQPHIVEGESSRAAGWDAYGFVQGTAHKNGDRNDNDRAGLGGGWQMFDRFRLKAEGSAGDGGTGGLVGGDYRINDRSNAYLNFTAETERPDVNSRGRYSTAVFGAKSRATDQMTVYGETKSTSGAGPESLVHAFGLDLSPNDKWTYGLKGERGTVSDPVAGDLRRWTAGVTAAYKHAKTSFGSGLEYRDETGTNGDRQIWLMRNALSYQATPDWRLLGKANFSLSDNSRGAFYDGDFVELVTGAAFRPVDNDKWNTLFKYTYFQDTPSPGQLTANSIAPDYSQRSHVVSADVIYDLRQWLSIGGKVGLRESMLKQNKTDGDWFSSQAVLAIARADFHLTRRWDIMGEARTLSVREAQDRRSGYLAAMYYHLNKNVKAGVGYNFTDFSDNLTDLSYRSHGWFLNIVGGM